MLALPDLHRRTGALHFAVLSTLLYCGLRRAELCALRTTHLSTERGVRVARVRGKGNRERLIVLPPPVWKALTHYARVLGLDLARDQPLFQGVRSPSGPTRAPGEIRAPLDPSAVFYIVRRYARQAGITRPISPHSCRATAISNARDREAPDRAIQEFAGWASPAMITRYDKRRTAVEDSAAHRISYGAMDRLAPAGAASTPTIGAEGNPIPREGRNDSAPETPPGPHPDAPHAIGRGDSKLAKNR